MKTYKVAHHQRLPHKGQFSIERLFSEIRRNFPSSWEAIIARCPYPSKGLRPRLANLFHARRVQADLHHIVGDSHYLAFALPSEKLVLTVHDCALMGRLKGIRRAVLKYFWFVGPMRRAKVVTTISDASKEELRQLVGPLADKVVVIPNCIGAEFTLDPKPFNTSSPVCLQVGTGWNKNVLNVAKALSGTPCQLEIIGSLGDSQRAELDQLGLVYRELGRISDDEVVEAYRRCDFVVFASTYEGFGLPILEAHGVGRPVITSDRSPMPEVAGRGAILVDPDSVTSIRAGIDSLLSSPDLRRVLVEEGTRNVARFRSEAVAAAYSSVYDSMIATTPAP